MKLTKTEITENREDILIECPHCGNTEQHPIEEQRDHIQSFTVMGWKDEPNGNEKSYAQCNTCSHTILIEWDYSDSQYREISLPNILLREGIIVTVTGNIERIAFPVDLKDELNLPFRPKRLESDKEAKEKHAHIQVCYNRILSEMNDLRKTDQGLVAEKVLYEVLLYNELLYPEITPLNTYLMEREYFINYGMGSVDWAYIELTQGRADRG